ncbi:MAG TPA: hypothetical protein VFX15_05190 [Actinomycetes bacterium]|nr:hypothetical protein [Actinomycetes bacterium]
MSTEATLLDALRAVPGVAAADLEPDERPEGAGTLRLQLAPGADEIAVATSVNRVLREQFGLAVDAGRVQVVEESTPAAPPAEERRGDEAQAPSRPTLTAVPGYREPESEATTARPTESESADGLTPQLIESTRPPRILIQRMQLVSAGLGVTTSVALTWQGQAYVGESSAAATPTSVHRSVATATLRALEEVVGTAARFELEQLEINQLGPDRAVVVVVAMLTKLGSERLTGVSVVREDVRQAVIRATLDSLNRRLESLLDM